MRRETIVLRNKILAIIIAAAVIFTGVSVAQKTQENQRDHTGNSVQLAEENTKNDTGNEDITSTDTNALAGEDKSEIVPVDRTITIVTAALDKSTDSHYGHTTPNATIVDEVSYDRLEPNTKYVVKGILMDKTTKAPILIEGKTVEVMEVFETGATHDGSFKVEFSFDASSFVKDTEIVVFEYVYSYLGLDSEGKVIEPTAQDLIAEHTDINDLWQTVTYIPVKIGTTARDNITGTSEGSKIENAEIIDEVYYENLTPGRTYTVKGILMNKNTGKPLEINGVQVVGTSTFTPTSPNGSVQVTFKLDARSLNNISIVVFEQLYYNDDVVAEHKDINDKGQTIVYADSRNENAVPSIGTTAKDKVTGTNEGIIKNPVTIVDTVNYKNLTVNKEYTLKGVLMDKSTGKPLQIKGKQVTATKTFTPQTANGSVEIEFTFDASALKTGTEIVVFEELYLDKKVVAKHRDINDKGQTVTYSVKGNSPNTGDITNGVFWYFLAVVAVAALVGVLASKKKFKK